MFDPVLVEENITVLNKAPWQFQNNQCNNPTVNQPRQFNINDWGNEDPFTQTDLIITEEKHVQELIYQIRKTQFISNCEILATRLLKLLNAEKEEDPISFGISVESLRNFYNFLLLNTNIKSPAISLTPNLNIYVSWRSEKKVFSVHFLPKGDVHFIFFKPNLRHPDLKIRISGTATSDTIIETVSLANLDWIFE